MSSQEGSRHVVNDPPYRTVLKPYGSALLDLARERSEIVCLSGDLTRQCEVDLFRDEIPERFVHAGMAEANMMGMAAAMARSGLIPFVHTFGVFATRRPLDQIINAIAYPNLPVRIVGFMPGISSPGGPSHQAIDDVALMRSLPGMTVIDVADATETRQMVRAVVDVAGPVYVRLKRGEIPSIFPNSHEFSLDHAQEITHGTDVALFASGMMLAAALRAERTLDMHGVSVSVVNVPVLKPIDAETVRRVARAMSCRDHRREPLDHRRTRFGDRRGPGRGRIGNAAASRRAGRHLRRRGGIGVLPLQEVRALDPASRRNRLDGPGPTRPTARSDGGAGRRWGVRARLMLVPQVSDNQPSPHEGAS